MTRIGDLLERDFSGPIEESVKIDNHDPATVFTEPVSYTHLDVYKRQGLYMMMTIDHNYGKDGYTDVGYGTTLYAPAAVQFSAGILTVIVVP